MAVARVSSSLTMNANINPNQLGGAYPGNRVKPSQPYAPHGQFVGGEATAHFVSYGGGNALVLQEGGIAQSVHGKDAQFVSVTLPDGVRSGDVIHVAAPDGRINEVEVPSGFGPGMSFTVEFADATSSSKAETSHETQSTFPTTTAAPASNPYHDDGFASGFNNPSFAPTTTATYGDLDAYPSASDAKPVYGYTASTY